MRKSIFDIAAEKTDMAGDARRIKNMATKEDVLEHVYNDCTLFDFIDEECFADWKHRGHFTDVDDFLSSVGFKVIAIDAEQDIESLFTLIELVYNFWLLAFQRIGDENMLRWRGNFYHLKDVMDDVLAQYNHTAYQIDEETILVIEDKAEVTAAAEIVLEDIAYDIIRYNHRTLAGDVEKKKAILIRFGAELESKRKTLQEINRQLSEDIFFMLNNLNIRHNNCDESNPSKYKAVVADMTETQLEEWYDELYQMILLAFLLLDNEERKPKVKALKDSIVGG